MSGSRPERRLARGRAAALAARAATARFLRAVREGWADSGRALWRARAELATALAFLAGWALLTHGVARLTSPLAWTFSGGLLCLSLGGWRLLRTIVLEGMYALTRKPEDPRG